MLTMFMRNRANETSWEHNIDNTVYSKRRQYSCCMVTCISIGATLFFLIGLFQTVLVFGFARESSRNPILVMGPVFMGIGAMMYMAVIEMCISKHKKKKQVNNVSQVAEEGQLDEKEKEMIEQELGLPNSKNTIILRADQLPAMLTLNQEDLQRLGPDSKQMLMQPMRPMQPMMPPVDVSMMHVPLYYGGNPDAARPIPTSAVYQLPSNVNENAASSENGVTEQESGNGDLCLYVTCQDKPTTVPVPTGGEEVPQDQAGENVEAQAVQTDATEGETTAEVSEPDDTETGELTNPVNSPTPDPDAIPDEILEMLDKVQEMYRNDTPAEGDGEDPKEEDGQAQAADAQKVDA